jgi:hypothetical protein
VVLLTRKHGQLLPCALGLYNALIKKEFSQSRLVPRRKRVVLDVLERLLSLSVLIRGPGGGYVPIGLDEVLELDGVVGLWGINVTGLKPGLELSFVPGLVL